VTSGWLQVSYLCVVAVVTMIDAIATVTFRWQYYKNIFSLKVRLRGRLRRALLTTSLPWLEPTRVNRLSSSPLQGRLLALHKYLVRLEELTGDQHSNLLQK
jgi:hypothetical protein